MKNIFFTVGPTQLYETVPAHIQKAVEEDVLSISHRSVEFQEIYHSAVNELRHLMNIPLTHYVFFLSSGTEAMERTIESVVEKSSLHIVTGAFGERFFKSSVGLGQKASKIAVNEGTISQLTSYTALDKPELICVTQNDTSSGFAFPEHIYQSLKKHNPGSLIALDAVSCAPVLPVDFSAVDILLFSVQKCFGLPAGLGVIIISKDALEKAHKMAHKNNTHMTYHSLTELERYGAKYMTPETPNVLGIYLLAKVAADMNDRGIDIIRKETTEKARLMYEFFDNHPDFRVHIEEKECRSEVVIVVETLKTSSKEIVERLKQKGYVIGTGYSENKEKHIRIANYPAHSIEHVRALLQLI
jgi:phosphoserine aminotransferase